MMRHHNILCYLLLEDVERQHWLQHLRVLLTTSFYLSTSSAYFGPAICIHFFYGKRVFYLVLLL